MTDKEKMRRYLEGWRAVTEVMESELAEKLRALTEEESAKEFNGLDCDLSLYWVPEERRISSGLVEQQRIFAKGHKHAQGVRRCT